MSVLASILLSALFASPLSANTGNTLDTLRMYQERSERISYFAAYAGDARVRRGGERSRYSNTSIFARDDEGNYHAQDHIQNGRIVVDVYFIDGVVTFCNQREKVCKRQDPDKTPGTRTGAVIKKIEDGGMDVVNARYSKATLNGNEAVRFNVVLKNNSREEMIVLLLDEKTGVPLVYRSRITDENYRSDLKEEVFAFIEVPEDLLEIQIPEEYEVE
ncbi:MAG: hypothetical protein HYW25_00515 [Candidatus Aenigmarchaeota archaeon]|nr:hypothetical protein [Candidatus Aenigmarchaeota archaeon]